MGTQQGKVISYVHFMPLVPLTIISLVHGVSTVIVQNMTSGHIKVKKGTGYVFYIYTPSHSTESEAVCVGMLYHMVYYIYPRMRLYSKFRFPIIRFAINVNEAT